MRTSSASPPSIDVRGSRAAAPVRARAAEPEKPPVFTWSYPFSSREIVPCELVEVKHANGLTDQLAVAAMPPQGEALPVHDAAHHAFTTLPSYAITREDEARHLGRGPKSCRVGL